MAAIVVVDSEPIVRSVISRILKRSGHTIRASGNADEALSLIRQSPPDLVVTNVYISGVPGFVIMKMIRREFPSVQVLMVPGLPDDEAIRQWMGEPGFDVFPKPFTSDSLRAKVDTILSASR